ncbi:MAG TPA: YggS family pyridoxal phosphate-dependent enzyme [Dehalococcoidia bacterium]|nr:YggS family pyridoxal phosphate-dependent enzyme [Dehalococcoidia bacterium]
MVATDLIAANLEAVRGRIARAAERAGRDPASIRLVAISKTYGPEAVIAAWHAGQRDFGENRVQEAEEKIPAVAAAGARPVWHLVGHLQTNKVRPALRLFDILHSIDSLHLAEAIQRRSIEPLPVLIEVNVGGEASKAGFAPDEVDDALAALRQLSHLDVRGLMTVAPPAADAEQVRPLFRELAALARRHALPELSMGMSGDFEVAIEEGATLVRIGTAIFGPRQTDQTR